MDKGNKKAILGRKLEQITTGVHFGMSSGAIMELTRAKVEPDALNKIMSSSNKWAVYGTDNNLPQRIVDANKQDPTSSNAIEFKIKAHYAKGLMPHLRRFENGKKLKEAIDLSFYPEIEEFYYLNDLENYAQGVATDFEWFNNCYTELIKASGKDKIVEIERKKSLNVRAEMINPKTGLIEGYFLSGHWPFPSDNKYVRIPAFNRKKPFQYNKTIFSHFKPSVDRDYYPSPSWYSNAKACEVSSEIFTWILANLKNSVNIKYHIKIPQSYFTNLFKEENYDSTEEWMAAMLAHEMDLKSKMDEMLAGTKNVSKTFYSKFAVDEMGKPLQGWEIDVIENKTNHEAFLPAYNTTAMAISTAHNVDPTMTGIQITTGPNGSGSDVREKFNAYVQLHAVIPRQTSLEALNLVSRLNKWEVFWDYEDVILNTIDQAKSGFTTATEPTPTTLNK